MGLAGNRILEALRRHWTWAHKGLAWYRVELQSKGAELTVL